MTEDNQPKPPSWEEEIFESIDPGTEEKKREFLKQGTSWLRSVAPYPTSDWIGPHSGLNFGPLEFKQKQTPPPAPEVLNVPVASGRVSVLFVLLFGLSIVKMPVPLALGASFIIKVSCIA